MRVIKSIIIGLFFSVLVVVSTSFIISFVYEDEVSALFLKELNKRVEADFRAERVNLSLLRRFPNATVELHSFELFTADSPSNKDEGALSFTADHIYFQFDVVDIFRKNYTLDKIFIRNSQLNYSPNGKNKLFDRKKGGSRSLRFNIEEMVFHDLYYSLLDTRHDFFLEGHSSKTILDGNLGLNEYDLNIDSRMFVKELSIDHFTYARDKDIRLQLNLLVTPQSYRIHSGRCYFERIPFIAQGTFNRESRYIDVDLKGNGLHVDDLQLYVPWKLKKKLKPVVIDQGQLDFFARIEGPVSNGKPNLEADFSLNRSQVDLHLGDVYQLDNISLNGYVSNGRNRAAGTSMLSLKNVHAEMDDNELDGQMEINNFSNPRLNAEGSLSLYTGELTRHFSRQSILRSMTGHVDANFKYSGALKNFTRFSESIRYGNLTMDATLHKVGMHDSQHTIRGAHGFLYLNRDLHIDSLRLQYNQNDLELDGKITDLYRNISDSTQPYHFQGTLYSNHLDLKHLFSRSGRGRDSVVNFRFPRKLRGNLDFAAKKMSLERFDARRVTGNLAIDEQQIKLNDAEFEAFQGKAYAQADLKAAGPPRQYMMFDSRFFLEKVDIRQVFRSFGNFGQDYITASNLKGFLSGEITFSAGMNQHFKVQKNTVSSLSDIHIDQGELINFEPLMSLSNFVNLDELRHVTFSRLSNQITIEDQTVRIPEMDINSSSYDINVSGRHTFDNQFSYDVSLLLSQVLSRKARRRNDFESEFGNIQEDGVGKSRLYLRIEGSPDKYAIEYDKEGVKQKIREDLRAEKQELKQILHQEFGWFRKDSTLDAEQQEKEQQGRFNIKWEESARDAEKEQEDTGGRKDEGFIIQFEEDTLK